MSDPIDLTRYRTQNTSPVVEADDSPPCGLFSDLRQRRRTFLHLVLDLIEQAKNPDPDPQIQRARIEAIARALAEIDPLFESQS